jgi:hypothetical protein
MHWLTRKAHYISKQLLHVIVLACSQGLAAIAGSWANQAGWRQVACCSAAAAAAAVDVLRPQVHKPAQHNIKCIPVVQQ